MHRARHVLFVLACIAAVAVAAAARPAAAPHGLPGRLDDPTFWRLVTEFSEPGGYFRSDNFVSNETTFQTVIPDLQKEAPRGAYLGVGPDQNFTYIAALHPPIAFVVDVRRQNLLLHLLYKALMEVSRDRAAFLTRLFSRPEPPGVTRQSSAQGLMLAFARAKPNPELFERNLHGAIDRLQAEHHFALSADDLDRLRYVYQAFYDAGPDIRYSFPRGYGSGWFPTYAQLVIETDKAGHNHSYLSDEATFDVVRDLERDNLIVPVVGDFGGDRALRRIGSYLRANNVPVAAFYTSNVEQYLFQSDSWKRFVDNVAALPVDPRSVFIRAFFGLTGYRQQMYRPYARSMTMLEPIGDLVGAVRDGRIATYYDLIERSKN